MPLPREWDSLRQEVERLLAAPPLRRNEMSTRRPEDPKFALGDFLAGIPVSHLDVFANELGQDAGQFRSYREVAIALPPGKRVAASWSVHRNLRTRPEPLRDGLTVREANELVGGKPIDSKPDTKLSVEARAARVRAALADPELFEVIDKELAADRISRRVRSQARRVVSEHAARERELDKELRSLQAAKSVFEATVKAELDLNKATQLVHAIGAMMDDLPQSERILAALKELRVEITEVLAASEPVIDPEGAPFIVDGEVWQNGPARAALSGSNQEFSPRDGRAVIEVFDDGPS